MVKYAKMPLNKYSGIVAEGNPVHPSHEIDDHRRCKCGLWQWHETQGLEKVLCMHKGLTEECPAPNWQKDAEDLCDCDNTTFLERYNNALADDSSEFADTQSAIVLRVFLKEMKRRLRIDG